MTNQPEWRVSDSKQPVMLSDDFIAELQRLYPDVNVLCQINEAHEYADLHFDESNRFNKKGLITFLKNWMRRNQQWIAAYDDKFIVGRG